MVYSRRRFPSRRKASRKPRLYRKKYAPRKPHFFTETFKAGSLLVNQDVSITNPGQVLTAAMNSTPDFANYKSLYRNYKITKLEWIIIPRFAQAEPNQAEFNLSTAPVVDDNLMLYYRKCWVNSPTPAASDIAMLAQNGVKIRKLNGSRPFRITMRNPIVQENQLISTSGGLTTTMAPVRNRWCSFDDPVIPNVGSLLTYVSGSSTGTLQTAGAFCANVLCKMTFEVSGAR